MPKGKRKNKARFKENHLIKISNKNTKLWKTTKSKKRIYFPPPADLPRSEKCLKNRNVPKTVLDKLP